MSGKRCGERVTGNVSSWFSHFGHALLSTDTWFVNPSIFNCFQMPSRDEKIGGPRFWNPRSRISTRSCKPLNTSSPYKKMITGILHWFIATVMLPRIIAYHKPIEFSLTKNFRIQLNASVRKNVWPPYQSVLSTFWYLRIHHIPKSVVEVYRA
jgi:hypothetical protein